MIKIVSSSLPNYMKDMLLFTGMSVWMYDKKRPSYCGNIYESKIIHEN